MTTIVVRPREESDIATLLPILQRVYNTHNYPVHGEITRSFLASHPIEHSWIAEQVTATTKVIVGNISTSLPTPNDPSASLWKKLHPNDKLAVLGRLFVDPDLKGRGIAKRLIQTVVDWGLENGVRLVLFAVRKDEMAGRLYEALGWVMFGEGVYKEPGGKVWEVFCYVSPVVER